MNDIVFLYLHLLEDSGEQQGEKKPAAEKEKMC